MFAQRGPETVADHRRLATGRVPCRKHFIIQPERQAATLTQPCFTGWPVRYPECLLRDLVAAGRGVSERHQNVLSWKRSGNYRLYRKTALLKLGSMHQSHGNTEVMQAHIEEISRRVAKGAHAVLLPDRAGWHTTDQFDIPQNMTLILLPSRAPELNPVENIWQYLRQNWLSNRVFDSCEAIIEAACEAWNNLIALPDKIRSIGMREWAHIGQPS